jgi:hypothetical protein
MKSIAFKYVNYFPLRVVIFVLMQIFLNGPLSCLEDFDNLLLLNGLISPFLFLHILTKNSLASI